MVSLTRDHRPRYHARINDPKPRAIFAFANSTAHNPVPWNPTGTWSINMPSRNSKAIDIALYSALNSQFPICFIPQRSSSISHAHPSIIQVILEYLFKQNTLGENTFTPVDTDATYKAQLAQEKEQSAEEDEEVDEIGRRWRLPDFVVLATPYPTRSEDSVGKASVSPVRILVPSLPDRTDSRGHRGKKKQHLNNLSHILILLEAAGLQLEEQLRFTFSEFPWQTEAMIAIAGVDIYWLWWKAYRSDYDIEEGSPCVPSSDSDIGSTRTRHTGTAAIPFIVGTGTSDNEFSKLQRTVGQIVDDRKWKSSDDQYTEHQGKDLGERCQFLVQSLQLERRMGMML